MNDTRFDATQLAGQMDESPEVMRLVVRMVALPFTMFIFGMEAVAKAMQVMQGIAGQGRGLVGGEESPIFTSKPTVAEAGEVAGEVIHDSTPIKEQDKMPDQDLSGSDTLKIVRYNIEFVKRDYEVVFPEKEDMVDYDTTGPSWAALKISEFMGSLNHIRRPDKWKQYTGDSPTVYPPDAPPSQEYINTIEASDRKYIQITFTVRERRPREAADYDRQQVNVLRGIQAQISGLSKKIG